MEDKNNGRFVGLAALLTAGLASVCCIGPILAVALGFGSLGFAAGLVRYRPLFLALTAVILAFGFYQAYRKRSVECADGSCEMRSGSRAIKTGLWVLTAAVLALATFPEWSACLLGQCKPKAAAGGAAASVPAGARAISLGISGMDCAACTVEIKKDVEKLPGVYSANVDFYAGTALVETNGKVNPQDVVRAVAAAGYQAKVIQSKNGGAQ